MPEVAELDRAVEQLLEVALVTPTDPAVLMARARGRVRRRRAAATAAVAVVGIAALVLAIVGISGSPVRVGTRPAATGSSTTTAAPVPVAHVAADGQFRATVLPLGLTLREIDIQPAGPARFWTMQSHYVNAAGAQLFLSALPLRGSQAPDVQFREAYVELGGTRRSITLDGSPAVVITHAPAAANHPDQVFLYWFVDRIIVELMGVKGTPADLLKQVAIGLRPASVSHPPGIYLMRNGVLTRMTSQPQTERPT